MPSKLKSASVNYSTMTTSDIVNTVRASVKNGEAVTDVNWGDRIPECNQTTLQQIGEIFDGNPVLANSFLTEIFNRVGLVDMNYRRYTNPLKLLKIGRLEFGETVEEIAFNIVKGKCDYNEQDGVTDVFQITKPKVASALHKVNYQMKYPQSITRPTLRKAFTSESSLGSFIDGIITQLYNSYEVDELLSYKQLIATAAQKGFMKVVDFTPVTTEALGKSFIKQVKSLATKMRFPSTNYSKYGFAQFTPESDLVIMMDADLDAAITVDVWAAAFNMSQVDFIQSGKKIVIDEFPIDGLHAIIADRRFFQIYDNDLSLESIYNPSNRVFNYFLHVWEIISASPFMQAVAFAETGSGTITSVSVTPGTVTVVKGNTQQFTASVETTGIIDTAVAWSVSGGTDSSISSGGLLTVGENETVTTLTVTATSVEGGHVTGTASVTVG